VKISEISEIAAYLRKAATDMQEFAARNDDMDLPNQVVLPFITNFLTHNLVEVSPVNDTSRR